MQRNDFLLLLGMAVGASMAAFGLLVGGPRVASEARGNIAAIVGPEVISRESFETAVGLVERERQRSATAEERSHILDRLVDEELLLQQGLALGLQRSDRRLRADLVAAMIESVTAQDDLADPRPEQLRAFFDKNRALFVAPESLRVAQVFVAVGPRGDEDAAARANTAVQRLAAGEDLGTVRRELGDPPGVEIPGGWQPASRLRDYVGPAAAASAQLLQIGEVSAPQRGADGYRVLVMLERDEDDGRGFDNAREQVLAEFRRRAGDKALHDYLAKLRTETHVEVVAGPDRGAE